MARLVRRLLSKMIREFRAELLAAAGAADAGAGPKAAPPLAVAAAIGAGSAIGDDPLSMPCGAIMAPGAGGFSAVGWAAARGSPALSLGTTARRSTTPVTI